MIISVYEGHSKGFLFRYEGVKPEISNFAHLSGGLKNAPTLTVFKDNRYGIYVIFFGLWLTGTSLGFDFYLTF